MGHRKLLLLLLLSLVSTLSACCYIDFSSDVRELGDRYKALILGFYEKHQRYPTYDENDKLVEELGCKIKSSLNSTYQCGWVEYVIGGGGGYAPEDTVSFKIIRSATICQYRFHKGKDGKLTINKTKCRQNECIRLRQ